MKFIKRISSFTRKEVGKHIKDFNQSPNETIAEDVLRKQKEKFSLHGDDSPDFNYDKDNIAVTIKSNNEVKSDYADSLTRQYRDYQETRNTDRVKKIIAKKLTIATKKFGEARTQLTAPSNIKIKTLINKEQDILDKRIIGGDTSLNLTSSNKNTSSGASSLFEARKQRIRNALSSRVKKVRTFIRSDNQIDLDPRQGYLKSFEPSRIEIGKYTAKKRLAFFNKNNDYDGVFNKAEQLSHKAFVLNRAFNTKKNLTTKNILTPFGRQVAAKETKLKLSAFKISDKNTNKFSKKINRKLGIEPMSNVDKYTQLDIDRSKMSVDSRVQPAEGFLSNPNAGVEVSFPISDVKTPFKHYIEDIDKRWPTLTKRQKDQHNKAVKNLEEHHKKVLPESYFKVTKYIPKYPEASLSMDKQKEIAKYWTKSKKDLIFKKNLIPNKDINKAVQLSSDFEIPRSSWDKIQAGGRATKTHNYHQIKQPKNIIGQQNMKMINLYKEKTKLIIRFPKSSNQFTNIRKFGRNKSYGKYSKFKITDK